MIPFINFETHCQKKEKKFYQYRRSFVSRIHTSKSTTYNDYHDGCETFENRTNQATCNKCYRHWLFVRWLDSRLLDVKLEKGNAIEQSSGHVDCFPLLLEECYAGRISRVSWCFSLRPSLISMDYLFCYLDIHLFLN